MQNQQEQLAGMRFAIVGLGRMGRRHIEVARRLGMEICGLVDLSQASIDATRHELSLVDVPGFVDAGEMLEQVRPHALVIATTAPSHAGLTIAAAHAGVKYILCEKPMGVSIRECQRMMEVCAERQSVLTINHQMRFMSHYSEVKALISEGEIGPLSSILVAGSNFGLAMNASHYFEMFRYMTGREVDKIQAWFDEAIVPNPRGPQFEDRGGRLLARCDGGASMYIDFAVSSGHGLHTTYICRNGQIAVDELAGDMVVTMREAQYRAEPTTRYGMPANKQVHQIPPADTVVPTMRVWEALVAGEDYPDGSVGLHALRCLVAAHVSNESAGAAVRLEALAEFEERIFPWA